MKKILCIIFLFLSNSVKSEEVLNIDLDCNGKVVAFGAVEGKDNFSEIISIRNNYLGNRKLNIRRDIIFHEETDGDKVLFSLKINRMSVELVMIKLSNDRKTVFEITASCSKQKMKKRLF